MQDRARPWVLRGLVLGSFLVTLVIAGPRAWRVCSAHVARAAVGGVGPRVLLDRVTVRTAPQWARGPWLRAIFADLEPLLSGSVPIMDEEAARGLRARLGRSPWVAAAHVRRRFPDRFEVELELRRPVLRVDAQGPDGHRRPACLVDAHGVCLPWTPAGAMLAAATTEAEAVSSLSPGALAPDPRVRAAAAVAAEWRADLAPLVPGAPDLVEVDAANLGYRYLADGRWSEVRVGLRRADGGVAWFDYGHPPGSAYARVAVEDKALVLRRVLAAFPGLAGLRGGDLRFVNRWRDWLRTQP